MIRQCGWCKVLMGEIAPLRDKSVTHGICDKCEKVLAKEISEMKQESKK